MQKTTALQIVADEKTALQAKKEQFTELMNNTAAGAVREQIYQYILTLNDSISHLSEVYTKIEQAPEEVEESQPEEPQV